MLYHLEHMKTPEGRIDPAAPPFAPEIQAALDRIMPAGVSPLVLFTTLARNPRVFQRFMAGGLLDRGSITLREREIMIDRTTALCGSEYEWGVHVTFFAGKAGLTPQQIRATVKDDETAWTPRERLILALADALHESATMDESLWQKLKEEFSDEQTIELIALAGFYHMVSFLTNGLRLANEPWAERFPA